MEQQGVRLSEVLGGINKVRDISPHWEFDSHPHF